MQWKDITSRRQGETDRTPRTYQSEAGLLRVVVTRHIYHPPDVWVLNASPFFDGKPLNSKGADEAKAEALSLVRKTLADALAAIDG